MEFRGRRVKEGDVYLYGDDVVERVLVVIDGNFYNLADTRCPHWTVSDGLCGNFKYVGNISKKVHTLVGLPLEV